MSKANGIYGPRGASGCGDFHECLPDELGFCEVCRPTDDELRKMCKKAKHPLNCPGKNGGCFCGKRKGA